MASGLTERKDQETAELRREVASRIEGAGIKQVRVAMVDLNYTRDTTSGQEGLDLLKQIPVIDSSLPVVVMTAWGSVDLAVEAMRRGAVDYVPKPFTVEAVVSELRRVRSLKRESASERGSVAMTERERVEGVLVGRNAPGAIRPAEALLPNNLAVFGDCHREGRRAAVDKLPADGLGGLVELARLQVKQTAQECERPS